MSSSTPGNIHSSGKTGENHMHTEQKFRHSPLDCSFIIKDECVLEILANNKVFKMKKILKQEPHYKEIPRGSLHMRYKPAPKILQVNAGGAKGKCVRDHLTEEVLASLTDC